MSRHTPGPWNIHPLYDNGPYLVSSEEYGDTWQHMNIAVAAGEKLIGEVSYCTRKEPFRGSPRVDDVEEARANARLMVAAPELLAALVALANEHSIDSIEPHVVAARAAIAKAKGGA